MGVPILHSKAKRLTFVQRIRMLSAEVPACCDLAYSAGDWIANSDSVSLGGSRWTDNHHANKP